MTEPLGKLSFLSLLRRGLATGLTTEDGSPAGTAATALDLEVNFGSVDLRASTTLTLVGPGDIVGLDSRVVVRTFPKPEEQDAEFEHFALIEFDQADLPWRYTPAKENSAGQLKPWFNLIVFDGDTQIQPANGEQKLATVSTTVEQLPNLADAWAWAHVQIEGEGYSNDAPGPLRDQLAGDPGLFVARVVSLRVLEPSKKYLACLVPTFERGLLIGTGEKPGDDIDALSLAWGPNSQKHTSGPITLPVYYSWRFQTGTVGSFKELAKKIRPRLLPADVGRRNMDVSSPGLGLPSANDAPLAVEGALQSVEAAAAGPTPWSDPQKATWIDALKGFLADPKLFGTRVVGPPLYGQWYAAQKSVTNPRPNGTNPPWFYELDTDPRTRVAAALGTTVIQNEQQSLLASGWAQVGELPQINYERKVLQLGREALLRLYSRHVLTGSEFSFFSLTSSLHGRVFCGNQTVCVETDESRIGRSIFDPAWRRWTRTWGWLGRRQGRPSLPAGFVPGLLTRLNNGERPAPEPGPPDGLTTTAVAFDGVVPGNLSLTLILLLLNLGTQDLEYWGLLILWVVRDLLVKQNGDCYWLAVKALRFAIGLIRMAASEQDVRLRLALVFGTVTATDIQNALPNANFSVSSTVPSPQPVPPTPGGPGAVDSPDAAAFRAALILLFNDLAAPPTIPFPPAMDLEKCRLSLVAALDPNLTVSESMRHRLVIDPSVEWQNADDLEPLFAPPDYEQPMYLPLSEVSKDHILPGLNKIKRDSAALAVTNQRFIEAYMVGLNHEMTRELRWNEFPTDQRGTYFRQFWDLRGIVPAEGLTTLPADQFRDILPIRQWSKDSSLGQNSARTSPERLVLVIRAQLIQRYPNVIVYAVQAKPASEGPGLTDPPIEKHPIFYALLKPDVAFYGFDLTPEEVKADPGWFFVLQEQPGEPKFFVPVNDPIPTGGSIFAPPDTLASTVADETYEVPFRVGIHGSTMLG